MSQIRSALSLMVALIGPVALMLLGAVVALGLFHGEGAGQHEGAGHGARAVPSHMGRAYVDDDGKTVHLYLKVEQTAASRALVLHGEDGTELARLFVFRDGRFDLEPVESSPFRYVAYRLASGSVGMGVVTSRGRLSFKARSDGSADIQFEDAKGTVEHSVHVDAEGGISPR